MLDTAYKLAVTGKGGVGKTTVAALLCRAFVDRGYSVIAVDADPDANFAAALGIPPDAVGGPLVEMSDLIKERTGAEPGSVGSFFKLNPRVEDLPEKLWVEQNGIRFLQMGTVKKGGGGCICPESAMLRAFMQNLILYRRECVIMDMEAGIEHLGRATAQAVNSLVVVVEPGARSIDTARRIASLAGDIKLSRVAVVGNKVREPGDLEFIRSAVGELSVLGALPFDPAIIEADMRNRPPWEASPQSFQAVTGILDSLLQQQAGQ